MSDDLKRRISEGAYKIDLTDASEETKEEVRRVLTKIKKAAEEQGPVKLSPQTERRVQFMIRESFGHTDAGELFDEIEELVKVLRKIRYAVNHTDGLTREEVHEMNSVLSNYEDWDLG